MLRSLKKLARGFMIVFTTFFVEIIETLRAESKLRSKLKLSCSSVEEDIDPNDNSFHILKEGLLKKTYWCESEIHPWVPMLKIAIGLDQSGI